MLIQLRTEDKALRNAIEILLIEQGERLLPDRPEEMLPGEGGLLPDCVFTDLDSCAPLQTAETDGDTPPEYTISFHAETRPTLLRPFREELFSAVLLSAQDRTRNGADSSAENAPSDEKRAALPNARTDALFFDGGTVYLAGQKIELSGRERQVFAILYEAGGKPVTVQTLAESVWHSPDAENSVRVYIRYLRKKLESVTDRSYIKTVRGGAFQLIGAAAG